MDKKVYELGSLPDPLAGIPRPNAKKVAEVCYGKGQPWIDHQDLIWQSDWNGEEVGHDNVPVVGLYRWRDSEVYVYINAETAEIIGIWENDSY